VICCAKRCLFYYLLW